MGRIEEMPRYAVIAGYLRRFAAGGRHLDVGCGEGILLRELSTADFSSYTGLDLSETAIRRAWRDYGDMASFVVADADVFVPSGSFDAIVFNEVQYCLSSPMAVLREYRGLLRPGGVLVMSSFRGSPRAMGILRRAKESFVLRAESVTTSSSGASWSCSVFDAA